VDLKTLGWNEFFETNRVEENRASCVPARVVSQHRGLWRVAGAFAECWAEPAGKLRLAADAGGVWPVVGDWVEVSFAPPSERAAMQLVLPRRSQFSRASPGKHVQQQVIAANVDVALLVVALDGDFNVRRTERYLAQCREAGARPVIVLNKADACDDTGLKIGEMEDVALDAPVVSISGLTGENVEALREFLVPGQTHILLGSSGTGKSTLANRLLGEMIQDTGEVRESDSKGRHTTTARQLFVLPGGALLMDTPGLRELQLWDAGEGVAQTFADIDELVGQCRFQDCTHGAEPGCAVRAALDDGTLDAARFESYGRLQREQKFQQGKVDPAARREQKEKIVKLMRDVRKREKHDKRK